MSPKKCPITPKFKRLLQSFVSLWLGLLAGSVNGESTDTIQLEFDQSAAESDQWEISWMSEPGYMYGLQNSSDLISWSWLDLQYSQGNAPVEKTFTSAQGDYFFRLKYTDDVTEPLFTGDFDVDGLNNYFETTHSSVMGLNPLDSDSDDNGVIDGLEDSDGDGILDGEEATYGLNPLVNDAMLDLDGDGYPNIYELRNHGGNPNDALAAPVLSYTVAADGSGDYATLQDAIDAATADYSIIVVKAGVYTGAGNPDFTIGSNDPSILLISEDGAVNTVLDGAGTLRGGQINNFRSAIVGFTVSNCTSTSAGGGLNIAGDEALIYDCTVRDNKTTSNGGGVYINRHNTRLENCDVYGNKSTRRGGGIYVSNNGASSIIESCKIHDNESGSDAGGVRLYKVSNVHIRNTLICSNQAASNGGAINFSGVSGIQLLHTTMHNNKAVGSGNELYKNGGSTTDVTLTNCIVWNDYETDVLSGDTLNASFSIIRETSGYTASATVTNVDPNLTFQGFLTGASTEAIDRGTYTEVVADIHGEARPMGSASDIGADEWIDSDEDGLPDWIENQGIVDADGDADSDNFLNLDEYNLSTNILDSDSDDDGVLDGDEVNVYQTNPLDSDSDGDGILDGEEATYGLNPLVNDAMLDLDGDGYPNIYELRNHGGNPNDALAAPVLSYTVAADGSGDYATLQDAIDAATADYSIIVVKAGVYTGAGNPDFLISKSDPKMLLISEDGAGSTILDGEGARHGGRIFKERTALAGFTIRNCTSHGLYVSATGERTLIANCKIHGNKTSYNGGGLYLSTATLVANCEIYDNRSSKYGGGIFMGDSTVIQNTLIFRNYAKSTGGGIYCNYPSAAELLHTTLYNNTAANGSELYKIGAYGLTLANSIVWNDTETDTNAINGSSISAAYSVIKDTTGYETNGTVSNDNPYLTARGLLTGTSNVAIDASADTKIVSDVHGEVRPYGDSSDIGADEWVDEDDDGLPDWLEKLGVTIAGDDEDGDGLVNISEYEEDTDPFDTDSDQDGVVDGDEVNEYGTDPLAVDTDGDEMLDGEEIARGLDPLVNDAMLDLDGDSYPNIYELRNPGGDPNDASVAPALSYTVATDGSGDYATLQDAIDAATADYSIILVKAGTYTGAGNPDFEISESDPKMLLISQEGADNTVLDGENVRRGGLIRSDRSALAGFTIRNCAGASWGGGLYATGDEVLIANNVLHDNRATSSGGGIGLSGGENIIISGCEIYGNEALNEGGGVTTLSNENTLIKDCRIYNNKATDYGGGLYMDRSWDSTLHNTLIVHNETYGKGGGIYLSGIQSDRGVLNLEHVTLYNNSAKYNAEIYADRRGETEVIMTNSIVWNDTQTDVLRVVGSGTDITATYSIIKGTMYYTQNDTISNDDPRLWFNGLLTADSVNAIDQGTDSGTLSDIHGESRPNGNSYDIGADEYTDNDNDSIADWWENVYGLDPDSAADASLDTDNDGWTIAFTNLEEYSYGTDPTDPDSDDDHITDGAEVQFTKTNPLVPDSNELDTDFNMDGLDDSIGVALGYSPVDMDVDGDGLLNSDEIAGGTSPFLADTDGDGVEDNLDAFPTDPDEHSSGSSNPDDTMAPAIALRKPPEAINP